MSGSTELLVLRLLLLAVLFGFVLASGFVMRGVLKRPDAAPAGRRPTSRARLVVLAPASADLAPGAEITLYGEMSIGRDPGNGIVLTDPSVSARHAVIRPVREGWQVADLGSLNGTVVEGQWVDRRGMLLRGGEQLGIGSVVLRFQL